MLENEKAGPETTSYDPVEAGKLAALALTEYVASCKCVTEDDVLKSIGAMMYVASLAYESIEKGENNMIKIIGRVKEVSH